MKRKIEAQVADFYRRTASTRESEDWNKLINLLNKRKRQRKGRCRNLLNPGKVKKKQEKQNEEQKRLEEERKRHKEDERERVLREEESRKAEQARIRKEIEDAREKRLNEMKRLQQAELTFKLDYNELQSKYDDTARSTIKL